ncbi:MAG: flagellin [Butyrivibrio sp.]|nr:flagellin [Butyrivibrio sp.]
MSSVSSVSGNSGYSSYSVIANGGTYVSAAQGASELAMQERTKQQVGGLEAGSENLTSARSALKVEDGAMEEVTGYLQSIRELSIKAMNGTMSDSDKKSIQDQIDQYKKGIEDIANNTTYNEKKLLDGKTKDMTVASDANGSSETISGYNMTLESLGIKDYDVTKNFDLNDVDKALEKLTSSRTDAGAKTNGVEYSLSYNSHAALELDGFQMDKEERNTVDAYQKLKTKQALDVYQTTLQKKRQDDEERKSMMLFA